MKRWVAFTSFILATVLLGYGVSNASSSASWFGSVAPGVELQEQTATLRQTTYWGAPCKDTSFQASWLDATGSQITQQVTECGHQSDYGLVSNRGVRLSGTQTSYPIYSSTSSPVSMYPIESSNHALSFGPTSSNTYKYAYVYKNLALNLNPIKRSDGTVVYYKLLNTHNASSNRVLLPDGTPAIVQDQTLVHSTGGKLIFANMGRAQVLVNVDTQTARILGQDTNSSNGSPRVTLGINRSGSLAFVADNNKGLYRLYNTENCTQPAIPSNPEQCQFIDLGDLVRGKVSNIRLIAQANFLSDEKVELFISVNTSAGARTDRYILTVAGEGSNHNYLALGDSFASGEGASDYTPATNGDGNNCHISHNSYGLLLKDRLGYSQSGSIACSGAKMKDIFTESDSYLNDDPQATGKVEIEYDQEIFDNYLPGYRWQHSFVEKYKSKAITLSVGGNDINFGKKLQYCILTQYSCFEGAEQKASVLKEIKNQFDGLAKTYTDLKEISPDTRIYVVGYPSLVATTGDCALNVRLSEAERMLADEITEDLNSVIKLSAQKAGVFYVDASDIFNNYRLCEGDSWQQAVNGLTFGTDQPYGIGPISSASYHPNKLGHQLYADAIVAQTNGLTEIMPEPDETASVTNLSGRLNPTGQDFPNAKQPILEDGLFGSIVEIGDRATEFIEAAGYYLNPGEEYSVEIHSTPTPIGTATAVNSKTFSVDAQIPEGIEPGAHTVHIFGNNIAGEPIDIYKTVFVVSSQEDYDGDGVINTEDGCTFLSESGVDTDADQIDDGCDDTIGLPPNNEDDDGSGGNGGGEEPEARPPYMHGLLRNIAKEFTEHARTIHDRILTRFK